MATRAATLAICSLLLILQTNTVLADETEEEAEEEVEAETEEDEAEADFVHFGIGGGGPFFTALMVQAAGPDAEFGMLYGGKGFTYPLYNLRISGVGFGGGFGYGQTVGAGFGMGGVAIEMIPRSGKKVELPVGLAACFGGGEQTIAVEDKDTGGSWTKTESGFIFMPMATMGVEVNPTAWMKIGFNVTFLYGVAQPEDFWGFGGSIWLAFGQIWPSEG
jgi:hypothetical protein